MKRPNATRKPRPRCTRLKKSVAHYQKQSALYETLLRETQKRWRRVYLETCDEYDAEEARLENELLEARTALQNEIAAHCITSGQLDSMTERHSGLWGSLLELEQRYNELQRYFRISGVLTTVTFVCITAVTLLNLFA